MRTSRIEIGNVQLVERSLDKRMSSLSSSLTKEDHKAHRGSGGGGGREREIEKEQCMKMKIGSGHTSLDLGRDGGLFLFRIIEFVSIFYSPR
jgi:hypothetical protein